MDDKEFIDEFNKLAENGIVSVNEINKNTDLSNNTVYKFFNKKSIHKSNSDVIKNTVKVLLKKKSDLIADFLFKS